MSRLFPTRIAPLLFVYLLFLKQFDVFAAVRSSSCLLC